MENGGNGARHAWGHAAAAWQVFTFLNRSNPHKCKLEQKAPSRLMLRAIYYQRLVLGW